MAVNPKQQWTVEQYLDFERESEIRHEFYNGEIFAMAGAEPAHNDIFSNTHFCLMRQLSTRPCKVHGSDMRVKTPSGLYTYSDISVVCGERRFNDDRPRTLLNPTLIVEVLSPATESYDRGDKFHHYRSLPSLQAYVLIASTRQRIELFARQPNETWRIDVFEASDAVVDLQSIGCSLPLAEVYANVEFDT